MIGVLLSVHLCVNEPTAVLYDMPKGHGHVEDIIRYGTVVEVTQEEDNWVHVTYPRWHGWMLKNQLLEVDEDSQLQANVTVGYRGAYVFRESDTERGPFLHLPFETPLEVVEELPYNHQRWVIVRLQDGQMGYVQRSLLVFEKKVLSMPEMIQFSQQFLGIKYLWGGHLFFWV